MNKDTIEIKTGPCIVSGCQNGLKALIVAAKDEDVKMFHACENHYQGVHEAVMVKFSPRDYTVACYTELQRI